MKGTYYRQPALVLTYLIITSLTALLIVDGPSLGAAEGGDTTQVKAKGKRAIEIQIGDEGITVRPPAGEEKTRRLKGIVISEEGILLNGKIIAAQDLDTAMRCLAEGSSIIKFGEDITVEENECVDGDLVSFGGDITVRGLVTGDVAVIGGDLYVKSTGIIKGDITTVGGKLHQEPGAEIRGQRVGVGPVVPLHLRFPGAPFGPLINFTLIGIILAFFIVISLFLAALASFFVPRNVERIRETVEQAPLKSFLLGLVAVILFLPLWLLLSITIIGIIVAPVAYTVAGIMGFAGVSLFVGAKLHKGTSLTLSSPLAQIIVGALAIELAFILAWVFTLGGRFLTPLSLLFHLIGWITLSVAGMVGLGATIWSRFGSRSVVTAPASIPETPPVQLQENAGGKEAPEGPSSS